jgi:hypothetical protein
MHGRVAQLVEQCPFKAWVAGSNPAALTRRLNDLEGAGKLPFSICPQTYPQIRHGTPSRSPKGAGGKIGSESSSSPTGIFAVVLSIFYVRRKPVTAHAIQTLNSYVRTEPLSLVTTSDHSLTTAALSIRR